LKNLSIAILIVLVAVLASSLARVENKLYAMQTGLCKFEPVEFMKTAECLEKVTARESWIWNVWHGISG